ncbi:MULTISPECIES: GNAT family N-acetyltransferase [Rhodomicrobium]|uniref:GNAT family N-acetyltransferase n=1 Tax=Rhodomicrobium TaxID=1068 RepID=UPI000B4AAD6E|nr:MULTISPECIES: GNAT family N-acetyltransferase [Rhodomicrobium]
MNTEREIIIRVKDGIGQIAPEIWDACANSDPARYNPFLSHAFLHALEASGCVSRRTGWLPQHLVIEDWDGGLLGAMPLYLKSHSQGEYVFDHGWADAYERAGGTYYPKLQSCVPFTPVTGERLLTGAHENAEAIETALMNGAVELVKRHGASSLHITFLPEDEWQRHASSRVLQRTDQQFHWVNHGFGSFDDFLGELASRKRKALKKERREAVADGITIEHITGAGITEAHWDAFYEFYQDTGSRKWGNPYLNRRFFGMIGASMPERILLIMCKREGRYIAGALNIIGGDTLYGRYWGAIEHHPFLHFETCYYQAIDYAIAHGLGRVEAGAQGEHKLARGYLPQTTYSLHYLAHPGLSRAVAAYLEQERCAVAEQARMLTELGPFKKSEAEDGEA